MADVHKKIKDFVAWCTLKKKIDDAHYKPPLVDERDIWWAALGKNVGSEIGGKSRLYSRPVVILTKLSHTFFLVAPTTSQAREGSWYAPVTFGGKKMTVCLQQVRTIDYKRLYDRMGQLDEVDFAHVRDAFKTLTHNKYPPP